MLFKYQFGAKAYNGTLASKVEGANPYKNADKRVLYDRWKEPGDHAKFRRIDDRTSPYQTTRLVLIMICFLCQVCLYLMNYPGISVRRFMQIEFD
mgnify:CR=1 FL=1